MICVVQIYKVCTFLILLKMADAISNKSQLIENNTLKLDKNHVINKCCPMGQVVKNKKLCVNNNETKDFSILNVYYKNMNNTNKLFNEVFTISDGIFEKDAEFKSQAINVIARLHFLPYIIEDGSLLVQSPNEYPQWTPIRNSNFCVDYMVDSGKLMNDPMFWVAYDDNSVYENSDGYLTAALLVSCVFMVLVLIVYGLLPELQSLYGLILMTYVASLCMAFLSLAVIRLASYSNATCVALTWNYYFFFMAAFCWMTVMSFDIWRTFRGYVKTSRYGRRGERNKFFKYCLNAFGVPLLMTIGIVLIDVIDMRSWPSFITPHLLINGCRFEGMVKMLYLYTPLLILNVFNWIFFLMTAFNLWRLNRATAILDSASADKPAAHRTQMHRLLLYLKLSVVMGLSWLFEVLSFVYPASGVWYYTDLYNSLIGAIIFFIFVFKKKIYRKLYERYIRKSTRQLRSSRTYSTSNHAMDSREMSNMHPMSFNSSEIDASNAKNSKNWKKVFTQK